MNSQHFKKPRPIFTKLLAVACLVLLAVFASKINVSQAGNLIDVTATLSNSRLSFLGEVTSANGSIVDVDVRTGYEYNSGDPTDPIVVGDTLVMASSGDAVVNEVVDTDTLNLDISPGTEDFDLIQKTDLTVSFVTQSIVVGSTADFNSGYFRVLVPSASSNGSDGDPDAGTFDFDSDTVTVNCTADNTDGGNTHNFTGATEEGNAAQSVHSGTYHVYRCNYDGGDNGDTITISISDIVNPAPKTNSDDNPHDTGTADTYTIIVEHMDGSTVIDRTDVKVGIIEAVQVSAQVVPTLNFTIAGVSNGTTNCGEANDVTTTTTTVPFGQLSNLQDFTHAAQLLTITTNAVDGASVTATANDQIGLGGTACPGDTYFGASGTDYDCIWDANVTSMGSGDSGDDGTADWGDATGLATGTTANRGFGYSLEQSTSDANLAFDYDGAAGTDTYNARHFADPDAQDPVTIFDTDSNPTNGAASYVCYRIVPDALTPAGYYYNYITYVATAQF